MSTKVSPRPRKRKQKEEMKEQIVAQVHKATKSTTSSENDYANSEDNLDSKKMYRYEDKNENSVHTPSRDVSIDGETQINSKILSLIETEMKRDINKHSHFTDSRPQSLSFYEDEKIPEELSGNLELLSPEERKHYKKRKEDTEERNAYNVMQDIYSSRDTEEIINTSTKKSKSRKKRHAESELGMGDSREMMIPKEKRKSKKKKRETSPVTTYNSKRKHKKRDDDYELKNDVTVALEELQDDVFENNHEEFSNKPERIKKSPRMSDKLYVQKKNKFEVTTKTSSDTYRQSVQDYEDSKFGKRLVTYPIEIATIFQKWWMRVSTLSHGLLGGLSLGHCLYLLCNIHQQDENFLIHYAYYSDIYVGLFFALCVICIVSVFDRMDIAHLEVDNLSGLLKHKKTSVIMVIYVACLMVHLSCANYDNRLSLLSYSNISLLNITGSDLTTWNHLSLWRSIFAFVAWIFMGLGPPTDTLYIHLKNLETYLPDK